MDVLSMESHPHPRTSKSDILVHINKSRPQAITSSIGKPHDPHAKVTARCYASSA